MKVTPCTFCQVSCWFGENKERCPKYNSEAKPAPDPRAECPPEVMELLAEIEHDRWSGQAETALNELTPERRERWGRLSKIKYADLDEKNKELDRMQVREYWPVIGKYIESRDAAQRQAGREEVIATIDELDAEKEIQARRYDSLLELMDKREKRYAALEITLKAIEAQRQAGREEMSNAEYVLRLISEPDPWYRDMNPKKQVESIRDRARKALSDLGEGRKDEH